MTPKFDHLLFSIVEVLLGLEQTLEYLRDISHVKLVMTESWGRQEGLADSVKYVDSCVSQRVYQLLDFFIEARELVLTDSLVDLLHDALSREGEVEHVEA